MDATSYFLSCDWGTTHFRLRLVETDTLAIISELKTDQGIKAMNFSFLAQTELGRFDFFKTYLLAQIVVLSPIHPYQDILISGMASSSIGMEELEYATMPFAFNGSGLRYKKLVISPDINAYLISGIKNEQAMMRGEEVQAIGLSPHLEPYKKGILILPGTHSKHLTFDQGKFTHMRSFMTGELFEVLSQKSILAQSIDNTTWEVSKIAPFIEGLHLAFSGRLSENLIKIRAMHLLDNSIKSDNYYLLSGMLIGDELFYLKNSNEKLVISAPEPILNLYTIALENLLPSDLFLSIDAKALEKALLVGQQKILVRHEN